MPVALAYCREVSERAAFLGVERISFPKRRFSDLLWDTLICSGALVMGIGITFAFVIAFPELHRLPLILVKGWGAEEALVHSLGLSPTNQ